MKNKYLIKGMAGLMVALMGASVTSCDLDCPNPNSFTNTNYWKTPLEYQGNMTAMTNQFRDYYFTLAINAGELRSGIYFSGTIDGSNPNSLNFVENIFTADAPGFTNFASWYGQIANLNQFIYNAENANVLTGSAKDYMLGMAYGMRAFCFFQIHKMYGTGPLRLTPDVVLGNYDPTTLYMARAGVTEFINQIRSDIKASEDNFAAAGNYANSTFNASKGYIYWNPAATQMLKGEAYLWTAKVSTGDWTAAPGDIATAKTAFENVLGRGYTVMPTYADEFDVKKKATNTENIFAFHFGLDEAYCSSFGQYMWAASTGTAQGNFWQLYGEDGMTASTTAQWLSYFWNETKETFESTLLRDRNSFGPMRYLYSNGVYYSYDADDARRDYTFMPAYCVKDSIEDEMDCVPDFDVNTHYMAGAFAWKFKGEVNTAGKYVYTNDYPVYRLPLAWAYLAEIANYEGNNADFEKYMNLIRARAYGDKFVGHEVTAGTFAENETALLQEKTKEFLMEGQRWWDLRRMTVVKGGKDEDHMVFQPQSAVGYGQTFTEFQRECGLNVAACKDNMINTSTPVLDYATKAYLVLWPLDKTLLNSDPVMREQGNNPGY